ncbi:MULTISPECIES: hypothetical protein [Arenibacter]|nr:MULTISPECIES: hypothetical protein [Arenibacter]
MLSKKRKKELREIYEKKRGEEFVEGLRKEPFVSITDYIDLKTGYGVK